jgi:signal transduction histidine kinase
LAAPRQVILYPFGWLISDASRNLRDNRDTMDALIPTCQKLLAGLAADLDASRAVVELYEAPGGAGGSAAPSRVIATFERAAAPPDDALTWIELPVREGGSTFSCLRIGLARGASRPRPKPWRIAQTLAELVVLLNQMHWQQASLSANQASRRILPVTEEELQRIILDIHDGPVQKLFAASSQVALMQNRLAQMPAEVRTGLETELGRLAELLQASLGEIKTTVGALRPPEFRRRPLVSVMEGLIMQHEALTGVSVALTVVGDLPPVSLPVKIALYRILQEALANAYRHANVTQLDVRLAADEGFVVMDVTDAGRGFDPPPLEGPAATEREEHIGLRGMRDRAQLVGGQFRLFSRPGRGTRIEVRVPGDA